MGKDGDLVNMLKVSNKYILIALISPKHRRCVAYLVVRKNTFKAPKHKIHQSILNHKSLAHNAGYTNMFRILRLAAAIHNLTGSQ